MMIWLPQRSNGGGVHRGSTIVFRPVFSKQLHLQEGISEGDKGNLIGDKSEVRQMESS